MTALPWTDTVTISDGTAVLVRAPGVRWEIEALGAVPDLRRIAGAVRRAAVAGDQAGADAAKAEADEIDFVAELKLVVLTICHGCVEPKFCEEYPPRPGFRSVDELDPTDRARLCARIQYLRDARAKAAAAALDPISAGAP